MAQQRMKSRARKVQKMTRDGLVEENLSDKSTVKLSRRTGDVKMERKSHRGKEEYVESPRSAQQSRDAPESGKSGEYNTKMLLLSL